MMQVNRHQFDTILRGYYDQTRQNLTVEELVKHLERRGYRLSFEESEVEDSGDQLETELGVDLLSDEGALFEESEVEDAGDQLETELGVDLLSDEGIFPTSLTTDGESLRNTNIETKLDFRHKSATEAEQAKDLEIFVTSQKEKIEQNIQLNSGQIELNTDSRDNQKQLSNFEFPKQKILDTLVNVDADSNETDPTPSKVSNLLEDKSVGESLHGNELDKHSVKSMPDSVVDNFGVFSVSDDLLASPKEKEEQIENLMGITEKDDRIDHLGRANESKTKIDTPNDPLVQTEELQATSPDDDLKSASSSISDTSPSADDYEELFGNSNTTQNKLLKQAAVLSGNFEVNSDAMDVGGPTVVDSQSGRGPNETNVLQNDNSTELGNESDTNGETKELSQDEQTQTEVGLDKNHLQFDDNSSVVLQQINSQSNRFKSSNLLDHETAISVEEQENPKKLRNKSKVERAGLADSPYERQNQKGGEDKTKNQLSTGPSLPILETNKQKPVVNRTKVENKYNRPTLSETAVDSELEKLLNHITLMSETTLEPSVKTESEIENKAQSAKRSRTGGRRRKRYTKDRINQSTHTNAEQKKRERRPSRSSGKKRRIDSGMDDVLAALEKLQD